MSQPTSGEKRQRAAALQDLSEIRQACEKRGTSLECGGTHRNFPYCFRFALIVRGLHSRCPLTVRTYGNCLAETSAFPLKLPLRSVVYCFTTRAVPAFAS